MKTSILCLAASLVATPALAQSLDLPVYGFGSPGYFYNGSSHYTPTMQRQELAEAIALREEAATLLAADDGTLSPRNQRYVRRKAAKILGY